MTFAPNVVERIVREARRRGMAAARPTEDTAAPIANRYSHWYPHVPFATQKMLLRHGEFADSIPHKATVLYGGAVGGGKTEGLVMWAAEGVEHSDYAALLVRQQMVDMTSPGGILDVAHTMFRGTGAVWQPSEEHENTYVFPSGARIKFGPCLNVADAKKRYQGPRFARIGIDEVGLLPYDVVKFLKTRVGKPKGLPIKSQLAMTGNPLGLCHDDLVQTFGLTEEQRDKDQQFEVVGDGEEQKAIIGRRTLFIPANLYDNPYLDHEEYEEQFADLDAEVREAWLKGRWDVQTPGEYFRKENFNRVSAILTPRFEHPIRAFDIGITGKRDRAATGLGGWEAEADKDWIMEFEAWQRKAVDVKETAISMSATDPRGTINVMDWDNAQQVVIQDLVRYHNFHLIEGAEDEKPEKVQAQAREIVARRGFPIVGIRVNARRSDGAAGRNDGFTNHAYAGKVNLVEGDWTDEFVGMLLRLRRQAGSMFAAKGNQDEEWDIGGLIHNAGRMFGGRTVPEDRQVARIESSFEREQRIAQERIANARRGRR